MVTSVVRHLWGDLTPAEIRKFSFLGGIFFLLIGAYWILRTQKDAVFDALVGLSYQPKAKLLSWVVSIVLVLCYSTLVDVVSKRKLFIFLSGFFGLVFLAVGACLAYAPFGFADSAQGPHRLFGWFIYVIIESLGSLMVSLFWSFVTSTTSAASAKKGYPLIIAGSQSGALLGSFCSWHSQRLGNATLFCFGAGALALIAPMVFWYSRLVSTHEATPAVAHHEKHKTGMWEGLRILLTRPYVGAILIVSTLYEVITTILEFEMKVAARKLYLTREAFASFNGMYGMYVNALALLFALLGTSFLMRRFGLRFCLILFPVITAIVVGGVYSMPTLAMLIVACMATKGLGYALNNPAKEMMYIPTTPDIRFKAKSWIDQFGGKSFKAVGAGINNAFGHSLEALVLYGTGISLGLIVVWIACAAYVGTTFKRLSEKGEVID